MVILILILFCFQVSAFNPIIINTTADLIDINQISNTILTSELLSNNLNVWNLDGDLLKTINVGCNMTQIIFNNKYQYIFVVCVDINVIKIFSDINLVRTLYINFNWSGTILLDEYRDFIITYDYPLDRDGFATNTTIIYMNFTGAIINKFTFGYLFNYFWVNPLTHYLIAKNLVWYMTPLLRVFTFDVGGMIMFANIPNNNNTNGVIMDNNNNIIMNNNKLNMYTNMGNFIKQIPSNATNYYSMDYYLKYRYLGFITEVNTNYRLTIEIINENGLGFSTPYSNSDVYDWNKPFFKIFQYTGVFVARFGDVRIWNLN